VSVAPEVKSKILEIFLRIREERNAPYEEDNFIQFLVKPNGRDIDDSFKGLRYKNRFIDEIEMEFCISFPDHVFKKKWNLTDFAAYACERMRKPAINRRIAMKKLHDAKHDPTTPVQFIFLNLFLVPPPFAFLALVRYGWGYLIIPALFFTILVGVNLLLYRLMARFNSHQKALIAKISAQRDAGKQEIKADQIEQL